MPKEHRSCREFVERYHDSLVNCGNCVKFDRELRCKDEEGVVGRYEDTETFEIYDRMMRDAKDIRID